MDQQMVDDFGVPDSSVLGRFQSLSGFDVSGTNPVMIYLILPTT